MNHTLQKAGRSQLLIWKADTGWLTSLYQKNPISACWNNPGQVNLIEPNCLLRCNPNESCTSRISFVSSLKVRGSWAGFIKVSRAWKIRRKKLFGNFQKWTNWLRVFTWWWSTNELFQWCFMEFIKLSYNRGHSYYHGWWEMQRNLKEIGHKHSSGFGQECLLLLGIP